MGTVTSNSKSLAEVSTEHSGSEPDAEGPRERAGGGRELTGGKSASAGANGRGGNRARDRTPQAPPRAGRCLPKALPGLPEPLTRAGVDSAMVAVAPQHRLAG